MRTVMEETVSEGPSDAGSIPASSTKTKQVKFLIGQYRIQECALFGVLKIIKVTALYIDKRYAVPLFLWYNTDMNLTNWNL